MVRSLRRLLGLSALSGISAAAARRPVTLITFDVDGTLVAGTKASDASAHARAFAHAVGATFAADGQPTPLPAELLPTTKYHGSTDGLIALNMARAACAVEPADAAPKLPECWRKMYEYFAARSDAEATEGLEVLPGVLTTLRALAAHRDAGDIVCGLVTGNVEGIARKKMRAVGVTETGALSPPADDQRWEGENDHTFLGGFGSDYCSNDLDDPRRNYLDRGEQLVIAANRCRALLAAAADDRYLARVVHVGDAPSDVLAAKHCADAGRLGEGVVVGVVGVATGSYGADLLTELAEAPRPGVWEPHVLERGLADEAGFLAACGVRA